MEDKFFAYLFFKTKVIKDPVDLVDERFGWLDTEFDNHEAEENRVDLLLQV